MDNPVVDQDSDITILTPLTDDERLEFEECKECIKSLLPDFRQAGAALFKIKYLQLYRGQYKSWKEFAQKELGITVSAVDYKISAGLLGLQITDATHARQLRPLTILKSLDDRQAAWDLAKQGEALLETGRSIPSASTVEAAAEIIHEMRVTHGKVTVDSEEQVEAGPITNTSAVVERMKESLKEKLDKINERKNREWLFSRDCSVMSVTETGEKNKVIFSVAAEGVDLFDMLRNADNEKFYIALYRKKAAKKINDDE